MSTPTPTETIPIAAESIQVIDRNTVSVYKCRFCPKEYRVYSSYWAHVRTQHKGFKYKCPRCKNAAFSYPYQLLKHQVSTCKGVTDVLPRTTASAPTVLPHQHQQLGGSLVSENPWLM